MKVERVLTFVRVLFRKLIGFRFSLPDRCIFVEVDLMLTLLFSEINLSGLQKIYNSTLYKY